MPSVAVGIATGVATRGHVSVPSNGGQPARPGEPLSPEALFLMVALVFAFGVSLFGLLYWAMRDPQAVPRYDPEKEKRKAIEKFKDDVFLDALMKDAKVRRSITHIDLTEWVGRPQQPVRN